MQFKREVMHVAISSRDAGLPALDAHKCPHRQGALGTITGGCLFLVMVWGSRGPISCPGGTLLSGEELSGPVKVPQVYTLTNSNLSKEILAQYFKDPLIRLIIWAYTDSPSQAMPWSWPHPRPRPSCILMQLLS